MVVVTVKTMIAVVVMTVMLTVVVAGSGSGGVERRCCRDNNLVDSVLRFYNFSFFEVVHNFRNRAIIMDVNERIMPSSVQRNHDHYSYLLR